MRVAVRRVLPDPGTPARAVAYILFLHTTAGTVLLAALLHDRHQLAAQHWTQLGLLVGLAAVNVEAGRRAEGGRIDRDRPHKALSAWTFAAALILPVALAMLVVVPTYWHARLRGIRMPLWKWIGSAEIVAVSGALAHLVWTSWAPPAGLTR